MFIDLWAVTGFWVSITSMRNSGGEDKGYVVIVWHFSSPFLFSSFTNYSVPQLTWVVDSNDSFMKRLVQQFPLNPFVQSVDYINWQFSSRMRATQTCLGTGRGRSRLKPFLKYNCFIFIISWTRRCLLRDVSWDDSPFSSVVEWDPC